LIGNHGGLGGEQTDSYLFHPGDLVVPATRGSFEFKTILDSRRGLPGSAPKPAQPAAEQVDAWSLSAIGQGLAQVRRWLGLAGRAMVLDREAYGEIAADVRMTAPALLIALLSQALQSLNSQKEVGMVDILARFGLWLLAVVVMQITARFLRGKAKFDVTLRVAGFAQSAHVLELLGFIPIIGPVARFLALAVTFFSVWIGVASVQKLRGVRTLLLPVVFILVLVVGVFFARAILLGVSLAIPELLAQFGWTPAP